MDKLEASSENIRLRLAAAMKSEIPLTKKMANSLVIQRHFMNPSDIIVKRNAFYELESYRREFENETIFWINDIDRLLHITNKEPYYLDPSLPENYWYNMTLYETDT